MATAEPNIDDPIAEGALDDLETEAGTNLGTMEQDRNGDDVYNNKRVFMGFLLPAYYLLVPQSVHSASAIANGTNVSLANFGKKVGPNAYLGAQGEDYCRNNSYLKYGPHENRRLFLMRIMAMNYISLRRAGLDSTNAYVCSALRARWIITGAYNTFLNDSMVGYSEILIVDDKHVDYGRFEGTATVREIVGVMGGYATEFMTASSSDDFGASWITKHADNLWAATEHAFRVRGHHFKTTVKEVASYKDIYQRFLVACYEGNFEWPAGLDMFHVFHTAIHPFRIKTLPMMTVHFMAHGTLANGALIRLTGAPVGNALITTTVAALDTMRGEVWFSAFNRIYKESIDRALLYAEQILDAKYEYHLAAGLYGLTRKETVEYKEERITMDKAKAFISTIGAACQGMINALTEAVEQRLITGFALSNARSLEKAAAASPLITLRVKQLVLASIEQITDADDIKSAIAGALPTIEEISSEAN